MNRRISITILIFVLLFSCFVFVSCNTPSGDKDISLPIPTEKSTNHETTEEQISTSKGPMGGTNVCTVHSVMSYHSYSQEMIDLVGEENFNEWINASEKSVPRDGCAFPDSNVFQFINHFGIKREELEQVYYNTPCYYNRVLNLDVLYSGDSELVDEYYRNTELLDGIREKRQAP